MRIFTLLPLLFVVGACGTAKPSACAGFAARKLAITGAEHRGCAGEILVTLDAIEPPLRAMVSGAASTDEREAARRAYRTLRAQIREAGFEADYSSMSPGAMTIKWPDASVSEFNFLAFTAAAQYGAGPLQDRPWRRHRGRPLRIQGPAASQRTESATALQHISRSAGQERHRRVRLLDNAGWRSGCDAPPGVHP